MVEGSNEGAGGLAQMESLEIRCIIVYQTRESVENFREFAPCLCHKFWIGTFPHGTDDESGRILVSRMQKPFLKGNVVLFFALYLCHVSICNMY